MNLFLRFDGTDFTELEIDSNYGHTYSYFSTYQSKPLIIGGYDAGISYHKKMEMLENVRWNLMPDYPYGSK